MGAGSSVSRLPGDCGAVGSLPSPVAKVDPPTLGPLVQQALLAARRAEQQA